MKNLNKYNINKNRKVIQKQNLQSFIVQPEKLKFQEL